MLAFAKINLTMDVTGRREDGYHEVRTVMQSLELGDSVTIDVSEGSGVRFYSETKYLPSDSRNNAVKAAELYVAAALERGGNCSGSVTINCVKRIPICGGLGGSSTDAAAVLKLMNQRFGIFSSDELAGLSARLGADTPFLMRGGAALGTGIGDVLEPLPSMPNCGIVVVKPRFSGITSELFAKIDSVKLKAHPDTDGMVAAIREGDLRGIARRLYNVFEEVLSPQQQRMVNSAKRKLLDRGAIGASMSGSGAAVFGLFDDITAARAAFTSLKEKGVECYLTRPN